MTQQDDVSVEAQPPDSAAAPVAAPEPGARASRPRSSAFRWGVALAVVAIAIGLAVAAWLLLTGTTSSSAVQAWAPSDSIVYADVRLDLPGDQRQKLGQVLARFPGFADQSTLDAKLTETFDRIVKGATSGSQDYSTKIKPWFGGEIAMSVRELPSSLPSVQPSNPPSAGTSAALRRHGLALVAVTDPGKATAWFVEALGTTPHSTDTYAGVALVTVGQPATGAMAIVGGRVMVLGDVASVKAAIDTKGTDGLPTNSRFASAQAALQGDHLGSFYVDVRHASDAFAVLAARLPLLTPSGLASPGVASSTSSGVPASERLPAWAAGQLRAEGDALVVDLVAPHVDSGPKHDNRLSNVSAHLPGSTIAVVDAHDFGATAIDAIGNLRDNPAAADALKQVDASVAILGGFDALVGWIGDTDIVVTRTGATPSGGLVIAPTDRTAAERLLTSLRGLIALGGAQAGLSERDEPYNGATITIVDLSGLSGLNGLSGGALPSGAPRSIAYVLTDDVVAIGADEAFVKSVIDVKVGASLADDVRYKALLDRAGSKNAASTFVDVTAVRETLETLASGAPGAADYQANIRPYLTPFDALIGARVTGTDLDRSTIIVTVK